MTKSKSPWRSRPYRLMLFGKDERMVVSIDLTEDQAAIIGPTFCPTGTDGIGEYDIDAYVQMGPR